MLRKFIPLHALILSLLMAGALAAYVPIYDAAYDHDDDGVITESDRATAIAYYDANMGATRPVPLCDHDDSAYHALEGDGCHYDHEHKHNPDDVSDIFGPAGAWFGGPSISYAWETPHENHDKHKSYAWIVRRDIPHHNRAVWIKDFRLQVHADSTPVELPDGSLSGGYLSRAHSFSLEAQTCRLSDGVCGITRTGGWLDFGNLELREGATVVQYGLPGEEDALDDAGRRRVHFHFHDHANRAAGAKAEFFWYGRNRNPSGGNERLGPVAIAVAMHDVSANVVPGDLLTRHWFCPDFQCSKNDSTIQAHSVQFNIPAVMAAGGDTVTFSGYANRWGAATRRLHKR